MPCIPTADAVGYKYAARSRGLYCSARSRGLLIVSPANGYGRSGGSSESVVPARLSTSSLILISFSRSSRDLIAAT
jgi:hypothetical protein